MGAALRDRRLPSKRAGYATHGLISGEGCCTDGAGNCARPGLVPADDKVSNSPRPESSGPSSPCPLFPHTLCSGSGKPLSVCARAQTIWMQRCSRGPRKIIKDDVGPDRGTCGHALLC